MKAKAVEVVTIAGSEEGYNDGIGEEVKFGKFCEGICFNPLDDCLYVADRSNNAIRRVQKSGQVSTVSKFSQHSGPTGIAFYEKENCFFITLWNQCTIVKMSVTGEQFLFAGNGKAGFNDGPAASAEFKNPDGIAVSQQTGDIFVSDRYNHCIRKITPQGEVLTLTGNPKTYGGFQDGDKNTARLYYPGGLCISENDQSLFVTDANTCSVRKVFLNGDVETACKLELPTHVAVLPNGEILVSHSGDDDGTLNEIYIITPQESKKDEKPPVFAGGSKGCTDGSPLGNCFANPRGLAIDAKSNMIYVVDAENYKIRAIQYSIE